MAHPKVSLNNTTGGDNEASDTTQARLFLTEGKATH
jgi:hypothetical protein